MNKKILVGSIIAVVMLIMVSMTSAVDVKTVRDNHPPEAPTMDGPAKVKLGVEYIFRFTI